MNERCYIEIHSGAGPAECERAAALTARRLLAEIPGCAICAVNGDWPGNMVKSLAVEVAGTIPRNSLAPWLGTVCWVAASPFRSHHRRHNWFVGVRLLPPVVETGFEPGEVEFSVCRSGGPGGQHVNTTSSAVTARHLPSGIAVRAEDERSQARNRALALARLAARLAVMDREANAGIVRRLRLERRELERGNPVRTFREPMS